MIRHRAGNRRGSLDHIEPIHLRLALPHLSSCGKVARVADASRPVQEKITVQGENHIGLVKAIIRVNVVAESEPCTRANVITIHRFILMPLCFGKLGEELSQLGRQGGRSDGFGQNAESGAAAEPLAL